MSIFIVYHPLSSSFPHMYESHNSSICTNNILNNPKQQQVCLTYFFRIYNFNGNLCVSKLQYFKREGNQHVFSMHSLTLNF